MSACGFDRQPVLCLETTEDDLERATDRTVAWLTSAGASLDDPLMRDLLRSYGTDPGDILGCLAGESRCSEDVSWHGASIGIRVYAGSAIASQHVSVAITRGEGFRDANDVPVPRSATLGSTAADLDRIAGLDARLGAVRCIRTAQDGKRCTHWHVLISSALAPEEVKRIVTRSLAAHGFRIGQFPDRGDFLHVSATRYLVIGGRDPVTAIVSLRPDGQGHTLGDANVLTMGIG